MFPFTQDMYKIVKENKFNILFISFISILVISLILFIPSTKQSDGTGRKLHFFYTPTCKYCAKQKRFNQNLLKKYPIQIINHDITKAEERTLFLSYAKKHGISQQNLGVPLTIVNGKAILGFASEATTGKKIKKAIQHDLKDEQNIQSSTASKPHIPFLGEVDVAQYSLPMLAILLGLVDGFNPCAMWALVFLIGLVMGLHDYRKLWLLVGTFVLSSGILYFLFMAAWLNAFLLVGYIAPLVIIVGGFAITIGMLQVKDFFTKPIICPLPTKNKQKIMDQMRSLVTSPITLTTFFGIILLAFVVNMIEFICSSFIPAVFTQALALHTLNVWEYYFYLLLYVVFFMLDDLIIFSLAVFAVSKINFQYSKWCKLIGGVTLVIVGVGLLTIPYKGLMT